MSGALLVLPVIVPLATAIACLLARGSLRVQRGASMAGAAGLLIAAAALFRAAYSGDIAVLQLGAWEAPIGVTFVCDLLSAVLVLVAALVGVAIVVYSLGSLDRAREEAGYHALVHTLLESHLTDLTKGKPARFRARRARQLRTMSPWGPSSLIQGPVAAPSISSALVDPAPRGDLFAEHAQPVAQLRRAFVLLGGDRVLKLAREPLDAEPAVDRRAAATRALLAAPAEA